jgi:glyoxylase-like metal-dependent hydrolase (beta-lactamase superfamily II)
VLAIDEAGGFMKTLTKTILISVLLSGTALAQDAAERGIVQVTGDLYRAQNNGHYTVFLLTPEGIILSDTINRDFSQWLRAELDRRFGLPVRYVLYSHHDWDHASGGEVFADTAQFVGHETMVQVLQLPPANTPLPASSRGMDRNGNGRVERSEASANLAAQFDLHDADGDGALSGAEITRGPVSDVYPPQVHYTNTRRVTLGGKSVELIHVGPTHAPDMSVLLFPEERAIFLVDFVTVKRLAFRDIPNTNVDGLIETIARVESLDFDIAIGGHAGIGTKQDIVDHRHYLEDLRDAVAEGILAGQSLEQLQASITMDGYSDWASFDWLPLNIEGMHRFLSAK